MTYRASEKFRFSFRPNAGWGLLASALALACIGITAIGTVPRLPNQPDFAAVQTRWLLIAVIPLILCAILPTKWITLATTPLMLLSLALLLLVILPFMPDKIVPVRNNTRAWINLGFMNFQPSELAKIAFVLALARYMRFRRNYRSLPGLLLPFLIMFVPVLLILREPDLGTALLFPPTLFAILIAAGARKKHIGSLAGLGALAAVLSIVAIFTLPDSLQPLRPHQRKRIQVMLSQLQGDNRYASNEGYQQDKAMTILGSGRFAGLGANRSATILRFNPLPEAHNDMIFAVIVNRWGWLGGMAVFALFSTLIGAMLFIAARVKEPFARLSVVGFASLLLTQFTINTGMSLGLLPIIGITLPLVSYGGSSLVATFLMIGLTMSFASEQPAILSRPSFEFDSPSLATQ